MSQYAMSYNAILDRNPMVVKNYSDGVPRDVISSSTAL